MIVLKRINQYCLAWLNLFSETMFNFNPGCVDKFGLNKIILLLCLSFNGYAVGQVSKEVVYKFKKSDISSMYFVEDYSLLKKYKIDHVTWGRGKTVLQKQIADKMKINSVNISLIQEGGQYVLCGDHLDVNCKKTFWKFKKHNKEELAKFLSGPKDVRQRAVLDFHGQVVGVPWLVRRGMVVPMASVNDPGYKKWLIKKIDNVLKLKPNAIHFDEPAMESVAIKTKKPFGLNDHGQQEFNLYLESKKKNGWKPDSNLVLEEFDYKKMILAVDEEKKGAMFPLWKEFSEFKVSSSVKLFGDLVAHAKEMADWQLLVSANVSLNDWRVIPLVQYLDFIAPEVSHKASKLKVPDRPLYVYKMSEALNKPMVSTALGTDWAVIKKGSHIMLACSWIAQAYASGQFMNFPLKAWVPGSTYEPQSNIYPQLSGWIKEKSNLFDDYETVATHTLLVSTDVLRSHRDKELLVNFAGKLISNGVLFKIMLEHEGRKIELPVTQSLEQASLIAVFPEYLSENAVTQLQALQDNNVWEPSRKEMRMGRFNPELVQVKILGETGILALPRKKKLATHDAVVLHLLNRDYLSGSKRMKPKGPFTVKVSKKIFNYSNIKNAILHQPVLNEGPVDIRVNVSSDLDVKDDGEYLSMTIPFLDLWGIIEFN